MSPFPTLRIAAFCIAASTLLPNARSFSVAPTTIASGRKRSFRTTTTPKTLNAFGVDSAGAWSAVDTFFKTQPEMAAFLTCSFKASAADLLAQTKADEPSSSSEGLSSSSSDSSVSAALGIRPTLAGMAQEAANAASSLASSHGIDFSRNLGFLLYGGLYTGVAQHYLYNKVYPMLLHGVPEGWMLTLDMVVVDNLIAAPLLCLPVAYIFKTAFASEGELGLDTLKDGLKKYVSDVTERGLLTKYWSIWLPVQFLTFGVIPEHFRVTFVALVSFFWITILSSVSAEEDSVVVEPTPE